ncbi:MAG: FAD-dependent oxidoreductase, partial [Actinomycetota bacterium]|nr:FAD-dependent oxidoreductase [Actinomycetota bacterium]
MIIDARSVAKDELVEADVCIIGGGPAGMTLAGELADRQLSICLLESGGLEADEATESLNEGESVGTPYSLVATRTRRLGGSAHQWDLEVTPDSVGARFRPLDPIDFQQRDWVPNSGWPFGRDELTTFYGRAQTLCGLGPAGYDPQHWLDGQQPLLPFGGHRIVPTIFQFGPSGRFTRLYSDKLASAENVQIYVNGTAVRLETDDSGRHLRRVRVATLDGAGFWATAKLFILAAGGIENARLLLVSDGGHRDGLGNRHGLVGRFFMEHPHLMTGFFVPSDPSVVADLPMHSVHTRNGVTIQKKFSFGSPVFEQEGLLNYIFWLYPRSWGRQVRYLASRRPTSPAVESLKVVRSALSARPRPKGLAEHLVNVATGLDEIALSAATKLGWRVREARRRAFGEGDGSEEPSLFTLIAMSEQAPNPDSRITLSGKVDRLGMRQARLDWRLTPLDIRTLGKAQDIIKQEVEDAGLGQVHVKLYGERVMPGIDIGHHHMGT